jgi:hypothetical protein
VSGICERRPRITKEKALINNTMRMKFWNEIKKGFHFVPLM